MFRAPVPDTQIGFYRRLQELKYTMLQEALFATAQKANIKQLDAELHQYVKEQDLRVLAQHGLRGEVVFAVPYLMTLNPRLLGYYRLLLGFPQKSFYSGKRGMGFGPFKSMESNGVISTEQKALLSACCTALVESASILLHSMGDFSSTADFRDLTLLTLGPQLRGGRNNDLGIEATKRVFEIIYKIVAPSVVSSSETEVVLLNAAGRETLIKLASDPDIVIVERLKSGTVKNRIAIEIKGGTDVANAHNRLGEAEKSHQKAKNAGFAEFWTLIAAKVEYAVAKSETPTTTRFFYIPELMDENSAAYQDFRENIVALASIVDER